MMPNYIIIKDQKDLIKHFASHGAKCEYMLDANDEVYRHYEHDKGIIWQVYGCPICLKEFITTTKESRHNRAKKMLDDFNEIPLNISTYQKLIDHGLQLPNTSYKDIANYCFKIELIRQENE